MLCMSGFDVYSWSCFLLGAFLIWLWRWCWPGALLVFSYSWPSFGAPSCFIPSNRCWTLDLFLLSFSILSLNHSFILLFTLCLTVIFSPFMSPSSMLSSCFAFFVSSAHFVVVLLFVVNLFILWLVPFIILCSISTLFFSLMASGSRYPVSIYSTSLGVLCGTISILFRMLSMILLIFSFSVFPELLSMLCNSVLPPYGLHFDVAEVLVPCYGQ